MSLGLCRLLNVEQHGNMVLPGTLHAFLECLYQGGIIPGFYGIDFQTAGQLFIILEPGGDLGNGLLGGLILLRHGYTVAVIIYYHSKRHL